MITAARLQTHIAKVRASVEEFLLDTCTIKQFTGYTQTKGQATPQYTSLENVPCRIINKSGADNVQVASQYRSVQQAVNVSLIRVQLPFDQDVTTNDKIVINAIQHDVVFVPIKGELTGAFVVWMRRET